MLFRMIGYIAVFLMVNPVLYHTGVEDPLGCDALKPILEMVDESRR